MFELPSGEKRLLIPVKPERFAALASHGAEAVSTINVLNSRDRRQLESAATAMFVESQWASPDHGMLGHFLSCFEITLQTGVLHELDIAEIRKALTAHRIRREIFELQIQPG